MSRLALAAVLLAGLLAPAPAAAQGVAEPNDTRDQPAILTDGQTVSAALETQADQDWYRFDVPAGRAFAVTITGTASACYADIAIVSATVTDVRPWSTIKAPLVRRFAAPAAEQPAAWLVRLSNAGPCAGFGYDVRLDIAAGPAPPPPPDPGTPPVAETCEPTPHAFTPRGTRTRPCAPGDPARRCAIARYDLGHWKKQVADARRQARRARTAKGRRTWTRRVTARKAWEKRARRWVAEACG